MRVAIPPLVSWARIRSYRPETLPATGIQPMLLAGKNSSSGLLMRFSPPKSKGDYRSDTLVWNQVFRKMTGKIHMKHTSTDVLIIGAGGAGMYAAIAAARE